MGVRWQASLTEARNCVLLLAPPILLPLHSGGLRLVEVATVSVDTNSGRSTPHPRLATDLTHPSPAPGPNDKRC